MTDMPVEDTEKDMLKGRIAELEAQIAAEKAIVSAPSGLVDFDYAVTLPTFDWAGTTIGGQMVTECSKCGVLVRADKTDLHATMHAHLNAMAQYTGVQG